MTLLLVMLASPAPGQDDDENPGTEDPASSGDVQVNETTEDEVAGNDTYEDLRGDGMYPGEGDMVDSQTPTFTWPAYVWNDVMNGTGGVKNGDVSKVSYVLWLDPPDFRKTPLNLTNNTWQPSEDFQHLTELVEGEYTWWVVYHYHNGTEFVTPFINFTVDIEHPTEILDLAVDPDVDQVGSKFTFSCRVRDRDNESFGKVLLVLQRTIGEDDPVEHEMEDRLGFPVDGVTYSVEVKIKKVSNFTYTVRVLDTNGNEMASTEDSPRYLMVMKAEDNPLDVFCGTQCLIIMMVIVAIMLIFMAIQAYMFKKKIKTEGINEPGALGKGTIICSECRAKVPEDAEFCPSCGENFSGEEFECPSCHVTVPEDADYCPNCNKRFKDASGPKTPSSVVKISCSECGAVVPEDAKYCPGCGEPFDDDGPEPAVAVAGNNRKGTDNANGKVKRKGGGAKPPVTPAGEGDFICSMCGSRVPAEAKKCPSCGVEFQ